MIPRTLADFQNTRFELAALHAEAFSQRVFIDRCTELHVNGEFYPLDAASAKLVSTELQGRVMDRCLAAGDICWKCRLPAPTPMRE